MKKNILNNLCYGLAFCLTSWSSLAAQETIVNFKGQYEDVRIDHLTTANYIKLTAIGGDGGAIKRVKTHGGGQGAMVSAFFEVGPDNDQLQPGGIIRFIVGGKGDGNSSMDGSIRGVGGGGGTGIAYKGPDADDKWKLLMVAAGGGGSYWAWGNGIDGHGGHKYIRDHIGDGTSGYYAAVGNYSDYDRRHSAGAGAYGNSSGTPAAHCGWPGGPDANEPVGGSAYDGGKTGLYSGGWGFGAGGIGNAGAFLDAGGGGYSGGSPGGYGANSYLNEAMKYTFLSTGEFGSTRHPENGSAFYEYVDDISFDNLRLLYSHNKCLDVVDGKTQDGTNIQLNNCNNIPNRKWSLVDLNLHYNHGVDKCARVSFSPGPDAMSIELWKCLDDFFVYDGVNNLLRSSKDHSYCLDLENGLTASGTNVIMNKCENSIGQHWLVPGTTTIRTRGEDVTIRLSKNSKKCLNNLMGGLSNGNNIDLYDCEGVNRSGTDKQLWQFDGLRIRLSASLTKCLDLSGGNTSNGANIQLWECQDGNINQVWIYDGQTKAFRSGKNITKCIDVHGGKTINGTNIQLWDCNKSPSQTFEIETVSSRWQGAPDATHIYKSIQLANAPFKCVDIEGSGVNSTTNNLNVQLGGCDYFGTHAEWKFDGVQFSYPGSSKCLDVENHQTANGTNVRLWDCMGHNEQRWIYDGMTRQLHSFLNVDKCLDLQDGNISNNTNIRLWDCKITPGQRWEIEDATIVPVPADVQYIVPIKAPDLAVHSHGGAEPGSNIQLWTKVTDNSAEKWYFDGRAIKMKNHQDLCINLNGGDTSNGHNIELKTCNNTKAQKWVYDAITKQLRSGVNPSKCMEVATSGGVFEKGMNIQIMDCNQHSRQKFDLK